MGQMDKSYQNNSFKDLQQLPLLYEISGAVRLALVGLTAGWLAIQENF